MDIGDKEKIEIEYWKNHIYENPDTFTSNNIIYKLSEAKIFLDKIDKKYPEIFKNSKNILELGAGQGWASCIVKSKFPESKVISSDISPYAIESLHYWEKLFGVKIDQSIACKSCEVPIPAGSVDMVFTFQSFHHFGKYKETLVEIHRILRDGGVCLLLHEPVCSNMLHGLAHKRVNAKRPHVPEDVVKYKEIGAMSKDIGYKKIEIDFDPDVSNRQPLPALYYAVLSKIKPLQRILPCTANIILFK